MTENEGIWLSEISHRLKGINVTIENNFLKRILIETSKSSKPHCNLNFIKIMKMKPTGKSLSYTIYSWTKYRRSIPLDKLIILSKLSKFDNKKIESKIISVNATKGKIKPKFPIKINRQLGSIMGHILGDGSIDKKYKQVFFSNSEKYLLREFSNNMKGIFNIKPRIWMQKRPDFGNTKWDKRIYTLHELKKGRNCGLFYPTICGLILNAIFEDFAIGKDKKITARIMGTNKEFKRGFIRAFYDDECTVGRTNIRVFQDKKDILEGFKVLLMEFDITTGNIKTYIKRNKERYYFDIHRKSNFLKFQREIGFTSPKKSERLNRLSLIIKPWNAK